MACDQPQVVAVERVEQLLDVALAETADVGVFVDVAGLAGVSGLSP